MLASAIRESMGLSYEAEATRRSQPGMQAGKRAARKQHKQQRVLANGGRRRAQGTQAQAARQARGAIGGPRVHSGIDLMKQEARHRMSITIVGRLCPNGPCEAPTSKMEGR